MKRMFLCAVLASGVVFAAHDPKTSKDESGNPHLSSRERIALASSSPSVHFHKKRTEARIQKDKQTLIAIIPHNQ